MSRPPPSSTLFPYTTLFRSWLGRPEPAGPFDNRSLTKYKLIIDDFGGWDLRSEEHTSELQSPCNLVCRLLLEKKKVSHYLISLPISNQQTIAHSDTIKLT